MNRYHAPTVMSPCVTLMAPAYTRMAVKTPALAFITGNTSESTSPRRTFTR